MNMKKFVSLMLALVMVLAMAAVPAFADEVTYSTAIEAKSGTKATITAPENSRNYSIYQIFAGDLSDGKLVSVKWGVNSKGGTAGEDVSDEILATLSGATGSDQNKLDTILNYVDLISVPVGKISNKGSKEVPTGYYLIKDEGVVGEGEAYSLHMVEVVNNVTISPKTGTTESDKKVQDNDGTTSNWQDSADYNINDSIPFRLRAKIADDYEYYNTYKLTFHDTQSKGLTLQEDTVVVKLGDTVIPAKKKDGTTPNYTFTSSTNQTTGVTTFSVHFDDLKTIEFADGVTASVAAGSEIFVYYNAKLNDGAVIGAVGNPNDMHVTYSNNPNDEQGGNTENGETPNDKVKIFTYGAVVNKKTDNPAHATDPSAPEYIALEGAEFTLYRGSGSEEAGYTTVVKTITSNNTNHITEFTFDGLDAGSYMLKETVVPTGYNPIAPIFFTITAEHQIEATDPQLTSFDRTGDTVFAVEQTGKEGDADRKPTGLIKADVVNKAGSTLPETGGIGTTIFYVVGSVLLVGAAVVLITKRRMGAEK